MKRAPTKTWTCRDKPFMRDLSYVAKVITWGLVPACLSSL
jgi:hypothetical protein